MLRKIVTPLTVFLLWLGLPLPVFTGENTTPRGAIIRLGIVRPRPDFVAYSVCFSSTETGKQLDRITAHEACVNTMSVSADGKVLATGGQDRVVMLWDLNTHKKVRKLATRTEAIQAVSFSPDAGQLVLATDYDSDVHLLDVTTGKEVRRFKGDEYGVLAVAFSPDGKTI